MSSVASRSSIDGPAARRPYRLPVAALLLLAGFALSACERAFVPERTPDLEVRTPDLSRVVTRPSLPLRVRATSFRPISRVELDGQPLVFSEQAQEWTTTLHLQLGLNTFVLAAFDEEGVRGTDTLRAIYLPLQASTAAPDLPGPRGGHTATLLQDGTLLVTGGAPSRSAAASRDAFRLAVDAPAFASADPLNEARTGHTATLLPDGRVLILGGAWTEDAQDASDFVPQPELYDPATGRFVLIEVEGDPIRRIHHTAAAYTAGGRTYVAVLGGLGVIGANTQAFPLSSLHRYEVAGNRLVTAGPLRGTSCIYPATAPALARITGVGEAGGSRYLFTGSVEGRGEQDTYAFLFDFEHSTDACGFEEELREVQQPRIHHVSVELLPGLVAFLGGLPAQDGAEDLPDEVFSLEARRFRQIPASVGLEKRFGHTATKLPSQRILLLGGFAPGGQALPDAEYLTVEAD